MIQIIDKSIFDHDAQCIIHQSNCHNRLGSGIAAQIARLYPEAVIADNTTKYGDINKLGTFTCAVGKDGKIIYNLYGQYNYGNYKRQTNYEAFYTGMEAVYNDVVSKQLTTASVPYNIGCGLANGSWNVIEAIIKDIWEKSTILLTICKYNP